MSPLIKSCVLAPCLSLTCILNSVPQCEQCLTLAWFQVAHESHSFTGASPCFLPFLRGITGSLIGPRRRVLPAKSNTRQFSFPVLGLGRVPLPSICTHNTGLAVGRNIRIRSMPGKSNPVVSTLLFTAARYLPAL